MLDIDMLAVNYVITKLVFIDFADSYITQRAASHSYKHGLTSGMNE